MCNPGKEGKGHDLLMGPREGVSEKGGLQLSVRLQG